MRCTVRVAAARAVGTVSAVAPAMNLSDAELSEGCAILEDVLVNFEAKAA